MTDWEQRLDSYDSLQSSPSMLGKRTAESRYDVRAAPLTETDRERLAAAEINLPHCCIFWTPTGCTTTFLDGSEIESQPHATNHTYVIAHRLGYGDDLMAYCREHDFLHSFAEQWFHNRPSEVLLALAHGKEHPAPQYEEFVVQNCQRWLRANERPIIGGVDWDGFKRAALGYLAA